MTRHQDHSWPTTSELSQHLSDFGLSPRPSRAAMERELKKLMGPERFQKYSSVSRARQNDRATVQDLYRLVENAAEWGALFSSQAAHFLANGTWVTDQLRTLEPSPRTLVDFGCSTGVLTTWLAKQFPAARVIGLEREANFLAIARQSTELPNALPNVSFESFDYSLPVTGGEATLPMPPAQAGISTFGIDFGTRLPLAESGKASAAASADEATDTSTDKAPGELAITADAGYRRYRQQALPAFGHWRAAIEEGGTLLTVLRLPSLPTFAGVVRAAHEAGWSIQLAACTKLRVEGEQFPALRFRATESPPPALADLESFWHESEIREAFARVLAGYPAQQLYLHLHPRTITTRRDHHLMTDATLTVETGTTGPFSYAYLTTITGVALLKLAPRHHLDTVAEEAIRRYEALTGDYCVE